MGTLTVLAIVGIVLVGGYLVVRHAAQNLENNFEKSVNTPEGQKELKDFVKTLQQEIHDNPPPPPKAVSHANLGRFVSYN